MGKLGQSNLLHTRKAVKRGLVAQQPVSRDRSGGHMPLFFALLSPSLLPRPSVKGHFNGEHVLNSFVYLAAALIRHFNPFFWFGFVPLLVMMITR